LDREFDVPILFLVFNRPDLTEIVLERIRSIRPKRLFICADGPRAEVATDGPLVAQVRQLVERIDWPCEVEKRYHEINQGCLPAVSNGISWFFEHVERGIIIEDDCLPDPTFFPYCQALLERYADREEVMHIGGTNPLPPYLQSTSFYFSKYNRIWGWATWRRAWQHFDATLSFWPEVKAKGAHERFFDDPLERQYWESRWDQIYAGARDTWDYQWFLCRLLHGIAIVPMANLVSNLGFRLDAVHTKDPNSVLAQRPCFPLPEPLQYPSEVRVDTHLDTRFYEAFVKPRVETIFTAEASTNC
jgi:hypothetical protein